MRASCPPQIAQACGASAPHLYKVLRVLAHHELLDELPGQHFTPNDVTWELLQVLPAALKCTHAPCSRKECPEKAPSCLLLPQRGSESEVCRGALPPAAAGHRHAQPWPHGSPPSQRAQVGRLEAPATGVIQPHQVACWDMRPRTAVTGACQPASLWRLLCAVGVVWCTVGVLCCPVLCRLSRRARLPLSWCMA